ncbi:MAG TPA: DEAD/DEAH box helicase family protein [Gemmataceae bacterium]|nr:DEAD/DEAH box helicase family protein [Gemmataceae bacterium]
MTPLWPIQEAGVAGVEAAVAAGWRRIALTAPTGTGKTRMVGELVRRDLAAGRRVILYTNRRMLLEQADRNFGGFGLAAGVRAAGHVGDPTLPFQIATVQTEAARTIRAGTTRTFPAHRVYWDEGHLMTGEQCARLANAHREAVPDCALVYVTATPVGMAVCCDHLVVAGTTSDGRRCGALVPADHFGPSEPYVPKKLQAELDRGEDLSERETRKLIMRPGIFGFVIDNYRRLNPESKPSILVAPGVDESRWFAQEFTKAGIASAHVDGDYVWMHGREYKADRAARDAALEGSKNGTLSVLCNRFVLREGIDAPWLSHGILATIFGSLQSYLQSGGRLLRSHPGLASVTVQDHGGNWHRHGSLNADRQWDLTLPPSALGGMRIDAFRDPPPGEKPPPEPFLCPECGRVLAVRKCPCGYEVNPRQKTRPVMQENGELAWLPGDVYAPKLRRDVPTATKKWVSCYFRAFHAGMTFRQAEALFFQENHYWPLRNLKFMPTAARGWYLRVKDVPREELYS